MAPAITFAYFSTGFRLILVKPSLKARTIPIMVAIVTTENRIETRIAPAVLFCAAGYISTGIRGSQGPKIKIRNSIQGVIEGFPVS